MHTKKQNIYKIKKSQKAILFHLFKFRFLDRIHVQKLLHNKTWTKIIVRLNELTEEGLITKFYLRSITNKSAVYCLTEKSKPYLEKIKGVNIKNPLLKRLYKEKALSETFRNHSLFLADINLSLETLTSASQATFTFLTKSDLFQKDFLPKPKPDAYIAIKEKNGEIKRYFLVLIDPLTPKIKIKFLAEKYINYYESNEWTEATNHPFPKIILILPTRSFKKYMYNCIKELLYVREEPVFYLSTWQEIKEEGIRRKTLEKVDIEE